MARPPPPWRLERPLGPGLLDVGWGAASVPITGSPQPAAAWGRAPDPPMARAGRCHFVAIEPLEAGGTGAVMDLPDPCPVSAVVVDVLLGALGVRGVGPLDGRPDQLSGVALAAEDAA